VVMKLEDKKAIVAEVADIASKALSVVAVDYRGLKVSDMTALRAKAREEGVCLRVVRNTLARRALSGTDFVCLDQVLVGPIILAFSLEDPGAAARLMQEFLKKCETLAVRAIALGGQLLAPEKLETVAKLPTRNQAIAILMSLVKAPITRCAYVLAAPHTQMVRTVAAVGAAKGDK